MAIVGTLRLRSALYFWRGLGTIFPQPTIGIADRMDILGFYRGISAESSLISDVTLETVSVTQPDVTVSVTQPDGSITARNKI